MIVDEIATTTRDAVITAILCETTTIVRYSKRERTVLARSSAWYRTWLGVSLREWRTEAFP